MQLNNKPLIFSILLGTILEWYDFSLLGSLAAIISKLFFPNQTNILSLLATFSIFATGFIARPIGGIIFGHIGDRYGRKKALSISIMLMALPSSLIGILPTYMTAGIMAPVFLIILRLAQGVAASGEYPGAICFLSEIAPKDKRGLWSSMSMFGVAGGVFLGSSVCALLSYVLSDHQMYSWGWRIPFILSLPLGISGWYIRYKIKESEIFIQSQKKELLLKPPILELMQKNISNIAKVIILFSLTTVSFYMGFVYLPTYLVNSHKISFHMSIFINSLSTIVLIISFPVFGYLSDKINRKMVMAAGAVCLLILFYPFFYLSFSSLNHLLFGQVLLAISIGMFASPLAAATTEMFPTLTRYSGISAGLNIGASIFGGTTPLLATLLVAHSHNEVIPCLYPIILALLCLIIIPTLQKYESKSLEVIGLNNETTLVTDF